MEYEKLANVAWPWLIASILATARPLGMIAVNPLFARARLTGLLRGAVAIAFGLPQVLHLAVVLDPSKWTTVDLLAMVGKELVIGACMGFLLGTPLWAFEFAGDVLDQQRGATSGRLSGTDDSEDTSVTGTLLAVAAATLFVMAGGLEALASLLYASWTVWPANATMPSPTAQAPFAALGLLDAVSRQGLLLAMPIVIAMLLADTTMMLIGRFAQQLRIDDTAAALRNLVFCIGLALYCVLLVGFMYRDLVIPPGFLADLGRSLK